MNTEPTTAHNHYYILEDEMQPGLEPGAPIHRPALYERGKVLDHIEPLRPPHSKVKLFFQDLVGFMTNLFLWPIHGHQLIMHQIAFAIILPFLIIPIIFFEVFSAFLSILTCGCVGRALKIPAYSLSEPTAAEYRGLQELVRKEGSPRHLEDAHIRLAHTMKSYLDHIDDYTNDTLFGKQNEHANSLIKVEVGGQAKLFQYYPDTRKKGLIREYVRFVQENGRMGEQVDHTFVALDYSYFLGMLSFKAKTDIVHSPIGPKVAEEHVSTSSRMWRFFTKTMFGEGRPLGVHESPTARNETTFNMWPGWTRSHACEVINKSLGKRHLTSDNISLWDPEVMVTL